MSNYEQWQIEKYGNVLPEFKGLEPNEITEPDLETEVSISEQNYINELLEK